MQATRPLVRLLVSRVAGVEERDQDVGEHVTGEQDAAVREEDCGVADSVRLMLDDFARQGSSVRGKRIDAPEQLERDARRATTSRATE